MLAEATSVAILGAYQGCLRPPWASAHRGWLWVLTHGDEVDGNRKGARTYRRKVKDLQVAHTWIWPRVGWRTVTVTARTDWQRPKVALDAWIVVK